MAYKLLSEVKKPVPNKKPEAWTAKVIIAEKCPPKLSQNSVLYQQLILMDVKQTTVRASIYDRHIRPLAHTLKLGSTYLISNGNVKDIPIAHRRFVGELNWTITGGCDIVEVDEDHYNLVFSRITITPFDELGVLKNQSIRTTIIGVVIAVKPMRPGPSKTGQEYMIRDISVMDQSFETINLRLYSSYAENEGREIADAVEQMPIIIAKEVLVTTFEGIGLSTTHDTCIYINTPFEHVLAYKKWVNDNNAALTEIKALRKYTTLKRIEPAKDEIPSPIKDTIDMPIRNHCWIKATAKVKSTNTPFWYMSCSTCFTAASETTAGRNFQCRYCSNMEATTFPRTCAEVDLSDTTDTLSASMIGRPAEEFLQASASKLMELTNKGIDYEENIRLNITADQLYYIKALVPRAGSSNRGKGMYEYWAKKFELVALSDYKEGEHPNIPLHTIVGELTGPTSTEPDNITGTTTTPTVKRALFHDTPAQGSKKKSHYKED